MSYFTYNDKQIYYEETGEGTPLILLHGNTSCGKMFEPIVPALSAEYRVIVPDFLGNGRSDRVDKWPSDLWFDLAKQVKALCDHLGLKKVYLIGSIGQFFHKPIEELSVRMLLTGSLEDDMFPKEHCRKLFDDICAKTNMAEQHIFAHGGHPAMMSNMDEFIALGKRFFGT